MLIWRSWLLMDLFCPAGLCRHLGLVASISMHHYYRDGGGGTDPARDTGGDAATGVTIMRMDEGLDTGPILLTKSCPISNDDTGGTIHDRLSSIGAVALMEALPALADGSLVEYPQDNGQACYAAKIEKQKH